MRLPALMLAILGLGGCVGSQSPSVDDAKQVLEDVLGKHLKSSIAVAGLKKTNGLSQVVNGIRLYQMELAGTVEVQEPMGYQESTSSGQLLGQLIPLDDRPIVRVGPGTSLPLVATILFLRSEQGWQVQPLGLDRNYPIRYTLFPASRINRLPPKLPDDMQGDFRSPDGRWCVRVGWNRSYVFLTRQECGMSFFFGTPARWSQDRTSLTNNDYSATLSPTSYDTLFVRTMATGEVVPYVRYRR